jgi:Family of unknown function (DUF6459)
MTALDTRQRVTTAPVGPAGRRPAGYPSPGERQRPRQRSADPGCLSRWFAALFLEVEAGQRPPAHLEPLMDPRLVMRLAPIWVRSCPVGRILSVHGVPSHACGRAVYDAVVIVRRGPRVGALCLRLVRTVVGWRVEEAARPEDGRFPQPAVGYQADGSQDAPLTERVA